MTRIWRLSFLWIVLAALLFQPVLAAAAGPAVAMTHAFVDPALAASESSSLSVIVTGQSAEAAAQAVKRIGGQVSSQLWLIDGVGASIPGDQLDALAAQPGILAVVANKQVASSGWTGRPVALGSEKGSWPTSGSYSSGYSMETDQSWPVGVDVGADIVHGATLADGTSLTGRGVTVAVLDSGVFFAPVLAYLSGQDAALNFVAQADFLGDGTCRFETIQERYLSKQRDGYCLQFLGASVDGYGHGSHVAGIVGNRFKDMTTGKYLGIAPEAEILSIRILDENGHGNYEDAIQGIQYAVEFKDKYGVRVLNLSLSAEATVPYFVDPLNRAVEAAWDAGIVVVAAAGNEGPGAESITVPGNDPYVITVGAVDTKRTPGDWSDDVLPVWSATGPTQDGFVKPDVLAPGGRIVSFMFNDPDNPELSAVLAKRHPDYSETASLFRMSGTSMATAVTSGVVALMLQAHPELTPDQVKFRLMHSARPAVTGDQLAHNILQQGAGRIWAPDAVLGDFPADGQANVGMDIKADLAHGYATEADLAYHYQGPVQRILSDDGSIYLYQIQAQDGQVYSMGASRASDMGWIDWELLSSGTATWSGGEISLAEGINWAGGMSSPAGIATWSGGVATWSGGIATWSGGIATWSGGIATWSGGVATWSGGIATWSGGVATWSGGMDLATTGLTATRWVGE